MGGMQSRDDISSLLFVITSFDTCSFIRQLQRQYNLLDLVQLILEANKQLMYPFTYVCYKHAFQ